MSDPESTKRELPEGQGRRVLVTGATGYVGSHVVKLLLEQGFAVRALVRDPDNTENTEHLHQMVESPAHPLELVPGDIMQPDSLDGPLMGCELVCHIASSVRLFAKDPQRDIVDIAVEGTKNVLAAAQRVGGVGRVVITSSVAAVAGHDKPEGYVFTEADWNETATLEDSPYLLSKVLAERAAWDFHDSLPAGERFELVALNPVVVMGPLMKKAHFRSSPFTLLELLKRKRPANPRFHFDLVDVRDVAVAHLQALTLPEAKGRYLIHNRGLWLNDIAKIIAPRFPDYPIPTWPLPDLVVFLFALFDKRVTISFMRKALMRATVVDNHKSRQELGITYRPMEETLVDTCRSLIDLGLAQPKK